MTTVLICAGSDLESDLRRTLFWREDLERYVTERADEARMLVFSTEPNVVVVELDLPGTDRLVESLRASLPHPVSIVGLSRAPAAAPARPADAGLVDAVLALPPGPEWDQRLVDVLEVPTRKQVRFDVSFDAEGPGARRSSAHRAAARAALRGVLGGRRRAHPRLPRLAGLPARPLTLGSAILDAPGPLRASRAARADTWIAPRGGP